MHAFQWIIVIGSAWLLQFILTWFQIRHYRVMMRKLVAQYQSSDGFYLFSGVSRKALGSGAIVLIVVDQQMRIQNCQVLAGVSVFAKFELHPDYLGVQVNEVMRIAKMTLEQKRRLSSKKQSIARAFQMAAENATRSLTNSLLAVQ